MTKFQILSDLHLELGQQYQKFDIPVCAPYLILAGDIGRLQDYDGFLAFLEAQCQRFRRVFLTLGNHEFYGLTWEEAQQQAARLIQESRLNGRAFLLNRSKIKIDDVVLLGCTMWSKISAESASAVISKVKDFQRIEGWSIERHNEEHDQDVRWLKDTIESISRSTACVSSDCGRSQKKIVVVTHHSPIREGSSRPEHMQNPWTDAFATELFDADLEQANDQETVVNPLDVVDWWVFGHTHFTTKCQRGSVKLVSNQRGYVFPKQEGVTADLSSKASERDSPRKPSRFDKLMKALRLSPASRSLDVPTQHEFSADTSLEDDWGHFDVRRTIEM